MKTPTIILLTNDSEFEETARGSANSLGLNMVVGHEPADGARLFAHARERIGAIIVDLDHWKHGTAWLSAMEALARKIPAIAVSRLDPRFLKPLASRYGATLWLSKPLSDGEMTNGLESILPAHLGASGKRRPATSR